MKTYQYFVVDAFASERFTGNPAGVLLLDKFESDNTLQKIAAEINHAETSFLVKRDEENYDLRWFTPAVEVNLCGHATLAATHILKQLNLIDDQVTFHTRSGLLPVRASDYSKQTLSGRYIMNFPAPEIRPLTLSHKMAQNLGVTQVFTGMAGEDLMIELPSGMDVTSYQPDFQTLASFESRGVLLTAKAEDHNKKHGTDFDIITRCFFPRVGVPEDPVTGSAHCYISSYWSKKLGKDQFKGLQASHRQGVVEMIMQGNRVDLLGSAFTSMQGEILLP